MTFKVKDGISIAGSTFIDSSRNVTLGTGTFTGSVTIGGNTAIHAGNYGTYALPISGGTLTGTLTVPPQFTVQAAGSEGGEIVLKKGTGQTGLNGDVIIDTLSTLFRVFEGGGSFRQIYFDLVTGNIFGANGIVANINGSAASIANNNITDYLRITNTGGAQRLLMGNQDSLGVNNPSVIVAANGALEFGNGNTWTTNGGTVTSYIKFNSNGDGGINFLRGDGQHTTYIRAANHPDQGYSGTNQKFWIELGSQGGTHIVLNGDGGANAAENSYDHFTIWQNASNSTTGSRKFYVTNVGNVVASGDLSAGNGGTNTGLAVYHGGASGDYGRIRFYEAGTNNQTIHAFPSTWQGGTLASTATGSINIGGLNGVTFGAWNNISGYIGNSGDLWTRISATSPHINATSRITFGPERSYYIGNLNAIDTTPRRYEIARMYIDFNDWHGAGTTLVELQNSYFVGGDRQVYSISYDYNAVNCDLIESIGPRGRYARVICSSPVQVSGDYYYISIYVDVKYYSTYYVYVKTSWPEVTSHGGYSGNILVYQSPSGTNTPDFSTVETVKMRGQLELDGNTVLNAGNYTSYTVPRSSSTWYGSGIPGSLWASYSVNGGQINFGQDLPNVGQMGILIDGCYIAGEGNGFWSLAGDNTWSSRRGMYWDGTYLNFTTNSATARFENLLVNTTQTFGNYLRIAADNTDWGTGNYFRGSTNHFVLGVQGGGTLYLNYGNSGGSYRLYGTGYLNDSLLSSGNALYATAVYDNSDSNYFLDPASTSTLKSLQMSGGKITTGTSTNDGRYSGLWMWNSTDSNWAIYMAQPTVGINPAGNIMAAGYWNNDHSIRVRAGNFSFERYQDNVVGMHINSDGAYFAGEIRSPVFKDSENTAYYFDPANSSLSMVTNGNIEVYARSASWAEGIRVRVPSRSTWGGIRFTRDEANYNGNWAIGFTGTDSTDDLTFWGTSNSNGDSHRLRLTHSGNLTASGNVTAYSDERLKTDWSDLSNTFVEDLATVKCGTFTRIDTGVRQVGASAQSLQQVLPEGVVEGEHLSIAYGNAALASAIELAKRVVTQDQIIKELLTRVQALEVLLNRE